MTRSWLVLPLWTTACGAGQVTPERGCGVAPSGQAIGPTMLQGLAGTYELTLVNSERGYGEPWGRGVLRLRVNDSTRRVAYVKPSMGRNSGERPLAGEFVSSSSLVPSYPNAYEPARPDRPTVELIGQTLYFGGIDMLDGSGERLEITTITDQGFQGRWWHEGGIKMLIDTATGRRVPDPGGHFCAVRRGQA